MVVTAVNDERRGADLRKDSTVIASLVKRMLITGRGIAIGGRPLKVIEVSDQPGIRVRTEIGRGEYLTVLRRVLPPPLSHQDLERLFLFGIESIAEMGAA